MVPFVESRLAKPFHWENLKEELAMARNFCLGLEAWFETLKPELRETAIHIVHPMLEVLKDTGINKKGDELVIAWVRKESPYSCLRIRLNKSNLWLRILADSETCATFACIAPLCFECGKYKFRGSEVAPWKNKIYALETAVCLSLCDHELANPAKTLLEWASRPRASYWIGKCGSSLMATVVSMKERENPVLLVKISAIAEKYHFRLPLIGRRGRLKEKQASDEIAIKVVIVAERWKSP